MTSRLLLTSLMRTTPKSSITMPIIRSARKMGGGPIGAQPHFHAQPIHEKLGTTMATIMWLWVFYRAKEDGAWVLGFIHPWDAHADHGHDDHGHHSETEGDDEH
eukprot:CAMPEP_0185744462 /NCGR_PEP_ID=MMETSP1174-20130828/2590_1 /TAXON_ID=35687 /ORGANISM="Dictyocha speculum, Strain CCMP1381" /LENGTH=103 /DNA_ID=CAMNT_0028417883 /DNA_START=20 /DNA_END=331 /DNA_ORIENTATION=+